MEFENVDVTDSWTSIAAKGQHHHKECFLSMIEIGYG